MIDKNIIKTTVEEWLQHGDYYLVDVEMTPDGRIVIEIDHADGVWIEDCADLSRYLQDKLGEELGEYELEVGSAGIGQPFKVVQQYRNHIGKEVEVLQQDGKKLQGILMAVSDDGTQFTVSTKEKQHVEGKKRPVLVDVEKTFAIGEVKYTDGAFVADDEFERDLKRKIAVFRSESDTTDAVQATLVCPHGMKTNAHSWDVTSVVTADDLFAF